MTVELRFALSLALAVGLGCSTADSDPPQPDPPDEGPACVPQCEARECGFDGCEGSCGVCEAGSVCSEDGQCGCTPDCEGRVCGDNGCGDSCGTCSESEPICEQGVCKPEDPGCTPACGGKVCGDDGCDGVCGTCPEETPECQDGACIAVCEPDCESKSCGDDGCDGVCGECEAGQSCVDHQCEEVCSPACEGKDCGDDGCGEVCGWCDAGHPVCQGGVCQPYCSTCTLTGTVLAPEGTIPISGALVYATQTAPPPLPEQVFCDACIELEQGTPFAFSTSSGEFQLKIPAEGNWHLVVQKGTFRRVRPIDITAAGLEADPTWTTLPGLHAPEKGDYVPRMAVVIDSFDLIENTLDKLGLGDPFAANKGYDVFDGWETDLAEFFSTWENLAQYHIIFLPCDSDWFNPTLQSVAAQDALRKFVEAGGKLYVTDWSYDILKQTFPQPISWIGDDGSPNSAQGGVYDAPVTLMDEGLGQWLGAMGVAPNFTLEANWTAVEKVNPYTAPDVNGEMADMTPKVWVHAKLPEHGARPATISFQYGCGRALFSTYHTEGDSGSALLPQELALAYIVLEVSVCTDTKYND